MNVKGKTISKIGMVLGALIIISYNFGYLVLTHNIPTPEEEKSILMFGGAIVVIFSPIYLSIILDKVCTIFKK